MSEIEFCKATYENVSEINNIMQIAKSRIADSSWFFADNEDFIKRHITNEGFIIKAVIDQHISGFLIVRFPGVAKDNLGNYLHLDQIELMKVAHMESTAVLPEYRGRHILYSLINCAESYLEPTDYSRFMATVHPDNKYSWRNLERLGYNILLSIEKKGYLPRHVVCKMK